MQHKAHTTPVDDESNMCESLSLKKQKTTKIIYNFIKNKTNAISNPLSDKEKIILNTINRKRREKYILQKNLSIIKVRRKILYAAQKYTINLQMINGRRRERNKYQSILKKFKSTKNVDYHMHCEKIKT